MVGTPDNDDPTCFWRADLLTAATDLVEVIREIRPQVLITYDDFGGYGHPDHIQAHRVAHYAVGLAASATFRPDLGPGWDVPKIYWIAFPKSVMRAGIEAMKAAGESEGFAAMDPDDLPFACDDELVTTAVYAQDFVDRKLAAMREHATQISVEDGFFALSNNLGSRALGVEYYRLARGEAAGERDEHGRETDLFAGTDQTRT
jgi:N-acetyl-1-D-myo-inositol-2-amino-2-deoxy-alpha-D-glucopyranoside deacetylase